MSTCAVRAKCPLDYRVRVVVRVIVSLVVRAVNSVVRVVVRAQATAHATRSNTCDNGRYQLHLWSLACTADGALLQQIFKAQTYLSC